MGHVWEVAMTVDRKILLKALAHGLSARIAHVYPATLFAGMDWKLAGARPEGATHSVFQLLHHMAFWQEWIVSWLEGKKLPSRSGNWCAAAGPADREEWGKAVKRFRNGLERLKRCAREAARARAAVDSPMVLP
jgi:hypothetical protein